VLKRFWNWLTGNSKVDLNLTIEIKDLDKISSLLVKLNQRPVIIDKSANTSSMQTIAEVEDEEIVTKKRKRKKLNNDPVSAKDAAQMFASGGIEKAVDKTSKDIVSQSQGNSTDDKLTFLKKNSKGS
jgi:hypothetical protein